jgi:ferredoxin
MRVLINHRLCTGCGLCRVLCPEVFTVTECFAFLRVKSIPPEREEACVKAVRRCPLSALTVREDGVSPAGARGRGVEKCQ